MQVPFRPSGLSVSLARVVLRLWHLSLYALVLILPFELVQPWLSVGGVFVVTNVELVVFVSLGLWLAHQISGGVSLAWLRATPLTVPLLLLVAALAVSAIFAPSHQTDAIKVVVRWLCGIAVALMLLDAVRSGLTVWRLLELSVTACVVVAVVAWLEVLASDRVAPYLALFHEPGLFRAGGEIRASGTLAYSTIAALYLEINFIFVVGLLARAWQSRTRWKIALLVGALVIISQALVFTLTRSAFAAIALGLGLTVVVRLPRHRLDHFAVAALGSTAALVALLLVSILTQPATQLRFASETVQSWYRGDIAPSPLSTLRAGEQITVPLQLTNTGQRTWNAIGPNPVFVFYHWYSPDGQVILIAEGLRTVLPRDVAPNETVSLNASLLAPPEPGEYVLRWDLVREELFWFSSQQPTAPAVRVQVEPNPAPQVAQPPITATQVTPPAYGEQDRPTLWGSALEIFRQHPLLGVGAGNFRFVHSEDGRTANINVHANNTYLEMLAGTGLIGTFFFLVFLVVLVRLGWRALTRPSADSILRATLVAALAAFLIHGVTDYFLEFTPAYILFWLMVGLVAGLDLAAPSRTTSQTDP